MLKVDQDDNDGGWHVRGPFRRPIQQHYYSSSTDPSSYTRNESLEDVEDDANSASGDLTPTPNKNIRSRSPLIKTPSLVDELLSEIYARFGNGLSHHRDMDSSRRASASGSQVKLNISNLALKWINRYTLYGFRNPII